MLKFVRLYDNTKRNRWAMAIEMTRDYGSRQRGVTAEIVRETGEGEDTLANYYYAGVAALILRKVNNPKFSALRKAIPFSHWYKVGRALVAETDPDYVLSVLDDCASTKPAKPISWLAGKLGVESDNPRSPAQKARNHLLGLWNLADDINLPREMQDKILALAKELKGYVR